MTIQRISFSVTVDFIHTSSGCGIEAMVEGKSKIWARGEFPGKRKALIKRRLKNEEQRRQLWGGAMEIAVARIP